MRAAPAFDLFTIGHSNIAIDRFAALLQQAGVNAIVDVRSVPHSRWCPWFSQKPLAPRLAAAGMSYTFEGDALGGRPRHERLYRNGVADYEATANEPPYMDGLGRVIAEAGRSRLCLMCAEREPLDCHRCLLVARSLAERGLAVGHILHNGTIEPHTELERRLLALAGEGCDLFESGHDARFAAAYRHRAHAAAYRRPPNKPKKAFAAERR
ncbi:MAG: DUF488 domain-containing protein [Xanthobacteraceae bacterium]